MSTSDSLCYALRALEEIEAAHTVIREPNAHDAWELHGASALMFAVHSDADAVARHFWKLGAITEGGSYDIGLYSWDMDFRDGSRLSYDDWYGFELTEPEPETKAERVRTAIEDAFDLMAEATVDELICPSPELTNARDVVRMAYGNPKGLACLCPHTKVTTRPDWGWDICYTDGSMLMCRRTDDGLDLTVITRVPNPFED